MILNDKEALLAQEIFDLTDNFNDLTTMTYVMLKALQSRVCSEWLEVGNVNKSCIGCPLNYLGLCRTMTKYFFNAYDDDEDDES